MASKGEANLIIRATNDASKSLDAITSSLKKLVEQQQIVGDTTGKADSQLAELGLELNRLKTNLGTFKELANISDVLNVATAALEKQKQQVSENVGVQKQLNDALTSATAKQQAVKESVSVANAELQKQQTAAVTAKDALNTLTKEGTTLSATVTRTEKSLESQTTRLATLESELTKAQEKYSTMAAAVAAAENPTKRMTASLDAAANAVQRKQERLTTAQAKEQEYKATLDQSRAALDANKQAVAAAAEALKLQESSANKAKDTVSRLEQEQKGLTTTIRGLNAEIAKQDAIVMQEVDALSRSNAEFAKLTSVADQARAAAGGIAASMSDVGKQAQQAALDLAQFAAKSKVLAGSKSTSSSSVNTGDLSAQVGAVNNLNTMLQAVARYGATANVSMEQLATGVSAVGGAAKSLGALQTSLQQQQKAVQGAEQAWMSAEAEVQRLGNLMKQAESPTEQLAAALGNAQGKAQLASQEFQREQTTLTGLLAALQKAGVGAGTLTTAEAQLANITKQAEAAVQQGTAAIQQMGQQSQTAQAPVSNLERLLRQLKAAADSGALKGVSQGFNDIRRGAEMALGPVNTLKSSLMSFTAGAVSIYGAVNALEGVYETAKTMTIAENKMEMGLGSLEKAQQAVNYATQVAINLRQPILQTVDSYSKLAIAAKGTKLEGEGIQKVFLAFTQNAAVTHSSAAELEGVFKAVTDILSKGQVQAQELKLQLGNRLPGAMNIMARSLGISTQELNKMMEKGELTSDTLVYLAAAVSQQVAPVLDKALSSPIAKVEALKNQFTLLQLKLAESGFMDAVGQSAEKLTEALSRPETQTAIIQLGQGLADLVTYLSQIEDPLGKMMSLFQGIIAMSIFSWVVNVGSGMTIMAVGVYKAAQALKALGAGALLLEAPMLLVVGVIALLASELATGWLSTWAYNNFPAFAKLCIEMGATVQQVIDWIVTGWHEMVLKMSSYWNGFIAATKAAFLGMKAALADQTSGIGGEHIFGNAEDAKKAAAEADKAYSDVEKNYAERMNEIDDDRMKRKLARERSVIDQLAQYERKQKENAAGDQPGILDKAAQETKKFLDKATGTQAVATPDTPYQPDKTKELEKQAKKIATMREAIDRQINELAGTLDTNKKNDLATQLQGVEEKYFNLYNKMRDAGLDETSERWKTVDALKAQEMQQVKNAYAQRQATEAAKKEREGQEAITTLLQTRRDLMEQIKYADSKGDTVTADKLKAQYNDVTKQTQAAIDAQIKYWQEAGGPKADLAIAKLQAQKDSLQQVTNTAQVTAQSVGQAFGGDLLNGVNNWLSAIAQGENVFKSLGTAFRDFAAKFLLDMAQMIAKMVLFNAMQTAARSGGMWGSLFGAAASAIGGGGSVATAHTGGMIGGVASITKSASPGMFAGASRFHTGGVIGLQPDEVPIIAKKGEEMLTANDPRHRNNGGAAAPATQVMPQSIQVVNALDSDSIVQAGLTSSSGTKTLINVIKANKTTLKSILR